MNIAFIVSEFPSLSQTFVLNQICGLMDLGHDISIFALGVSDEAKMHPDVVRYGLLERTTYLPNIPRERIPRLLTGMKRALFNIYRYPLPILKAINVFKFGRRAASFSVLHRIEPFLEKRCYDIIHCHFGPCGNIGMQCIATGALRGKLVCTFHGFDLTSYIGKCGRDVYDRLFHYSDLCLTISDRWRERLMELGCNAEKVHVHRMGVDTKAFAFKNEPLGKAGKVRVLSVARFVEKKGIRYGIEAVKRIVERYPEVEYLIAGDGPLREDLAERIEELGLGEHVRLLGWMNQVEVRELMRSSDILLVPSVTAQDGDQEGIPVVLMEALAMGLLVVSTHHSGIPELIQDGRTGLLAPERDAQGLADRIEDLIGRNGLAEELRRNGRAFVEQHYDIEKLNKDLEGKFLDLLNGAYTR